MPQAIRYIDRSQVSADVRSVYYRAVVIAIVGNAGLLGLKAYAAWISGSSALFSDTANSASDVAYSLLMAGGLWASLRPPDRSHPHGHERIESLVTVFIGAFMAFAGIEALRGAIAAWPGGGTVTLSTWLVLVPVVTAMTKGVMYWRVRALGRAVGSQAIQATATDNLADILSSCVVLVGLLGARWSIGQADPIAGLLVALWVLYQAGKVALVGFGQLAGQGSSAESEQAIVEAIRTVPGILGIDKVIAEHVGPRLRVDIHVYADGQMTLEESHRMSHAVRQVVEAVEGVDHAFVHVEPAEEQPS